MGLVDSLVNGANKIMHSSQSNSNKFDSLIFVKTDSNGNYILPMGYNSVKKVGRLKEVIYLTLYDNLFDEVVHKIIDLNLKRQDSNAVYIDPKNFKELGDYSRKAHFQPLKLE